MTATLVATTPSSPVDEAPVRFGPVRTLRHSLTLTWRSLIKIKHSPEQLLDLTLQPIIFVLLFVYLFGGAVTGDRHVYLQFVLPGILVQSVAFASLGVGQSLAGDLQTGVFDRFRTMPIARSAPLIGAVLGDVVRYLVTIAVVLGFGAVIGFRIETDPFSTLAACALVLLFAFGLCWVTALVGLLLRNPRTVQGIGGMLMFPLTFGSNLFVPTDTLPGWLQAWVKVNPVTFVVEATRGLLTGQGAIAGPAVKVVISVAVLCAVFVPLSLAVYRRRT
ncbi:ABC transporter permease [Cryptosporangium arvum]|uniref:Transport permease protein n=1 Tax=Cryptosporangium arvum DSM 44712 TaxID=927661 RepID=A0A010ZLJ8_9ACTN|nr:ABC transporter permease [Cryptosporangium arvum]EXG79544.1 ABC-type multidrug transport system, permease component [Cryptosporangium arvum DSM 44712]